MLRVREDTRLTAALRVLGQHWSQNHSVLPGRQPPTITPTSDALESCADGVRRVCIDENHGRPPYKEGGPFFQYQLLQPKYPVDGGHVFGRIKTQSYGSVIVRPGDEWRRHYSGSFTKSTSDQPTSRTSLGGAEDINSPDDYSSYVNPDDLQSLGNTAYGKLRPKVENVNLLQAIAEGKDIPKMLATTAKGFHSTWKAVGGDLSAANWKATPKGAADQFLNVAFGWRPFVNDIIGTCDTVLFAADHIASRERNNDRWMHRQFVEEAQTSNELLFSSTGNTSNMCSPSLGIDHVQPFSGSYYISRQRMTQVWYEGVFKFYRPEFDKGLKTGYPSIKKLRQMATLLGLNLNATTLYRVTPWTWLVDWFANVGNNIQALEDLATNQVASKYMYLMRHTYDRFEYRCVFTDYAGVTFDLKWYKEARVKKRERAASPFGFSLPVGGLSSMQLSILAALGISYAAR